jgi:hypothetical protein
MIDKLSKVILFAILMLIVANTVFASSGGGGSLASTQLNTVLGNIVEIFTSDIVRYLLIIGLGVTLLIGIINRHNGDLIKQLISIGFIGAGALSVSAIVENIFGLGVLF